MFIPHAAIKATSFCYENANCATQFSHSCWRPSPTNTTAPGTCMCPPLKRFGFSGLTCNGTHNYPELVMHVSRRNVLLQMPSENAAIHQRCLTPTSVVFLSRLHLEYPTSAVYQTPWPAAALLVSIVRVSAVCPFHLPVDKCVILEVKYWRTIDIGALH